MKAVLFIVVPLVTFLLTLVGLLAMSGNLTADSLAKILGTAPAPVAAAVDEPKDDLVGYAAELKKREDELAEREAQLQKDEKRLFEAQSQMEELRGALQQMLLQISQSADETEATRSQRLTSVAESLGGMKPAQAAKALEGWNPQDGAALLRLIDERARGKILDSMDPEKTTAFLQAMKEQQ